jgi:hypothetical protein
LILGLLITIPCPALKEQEREYVNWLDSFTHLPEVVAEDVFNVARSDTNERPSYN